VSPGGLERAEGGDQVRAAVPADQLIDVVLPGGIRVPGRWVRQRLRPHNPANPRHAQAHPGHTRVSVKEEIITVALGRFMDDYLLGHDRAAMLQVQLPAGQAEEAERRDRRAGALRQKLAKIQTAQKGLMTQAEQLGDDKSAAACAMRDRIREQFTTDTTSTPQSPPNWTPSPPAPPPPPTTPHSSTNCPTPPACSQRPRTPSAWPCTPLSTSSASTGKTPARSPSGPPSPTPPWHHHRPDH